MKKEKPEKMFFLRSIADRDKAVLAISRLRPTADKPYKVRVSLDEESRSDKQNRLSFMWYKILGETFSSKEEERARCKLDYAIPILRRDEDFNNFYKYAIDDLVREAQLAAMDFIAVTSLMSVKEFAEYLTTVDQTSAANGCVLPHPSDLYHEALMLEQP